MKRKKKKLVNEKSEVIAIYLYKYDGLAAANIGERGLVSIEMDKGNALLKMNSGNTVTINKEEVTGFAVKNEKGRISTFAINQSGNLIKTINEDKYEKDNK